MNKIYCDHCKKELMINDRIAGIQIEYKYVKELTSYIQPIDLCIDCQAKFKKLLKDFIGAEDE